MAQEKIIRTLPKLLKDSDETYEVGYYQNGQYIRIGDGGLESIKAIDIRDDEISRLSTIHEITANAAGTKLIIIGGEEEQPQPTIPDPDRAAIAAQILAAHFSSHTEIIFNEDYYLYRALHAVKAADALIKALKQNKQDDATN